MEFTAPLGLLGIPEPRLLQLPLPHWNTGPPLPENIRPPAYRRVVLLSVCVVKQLTRRPNWPLPACCHAVPFQRCTPLTPAAAPTSRRMSPPTHSCNP